MSKLRERRHAETKKAIVDAAFRLFERHGFAATIIEDIADEAGVSRSTFYRRYASKEEIVLEVPVSWLAAWDEGIGAAARDATLGEVMAIGCSAVATEIDRDQSRVLAAYRALEESPALRSSGVASNDWLGRMVVLVETAEPSLERFDALTIAGAYMGAIDTMMLAWADSGGTSSVSDATDKVLDVLAPILPNRS
jgi:AcrR family transcriptional regulator